MRKNTLGVIFFLLGMASFLITLPFRITGNATASNFITGFSVFYTLGLTLIAISFIFFTSRQSLDAIVIPTGSGKFHENTGMYSQDEDRTRTALMHKEELKSEGYFVISGYKGQGRNEIRTGQVYSIYKFLRKHGIKPIKMLVEGRSHNSLENVLYTLKKIKERELKRGIERPWDIAFVSYPGHLSRFEDFEKEVVKKGLFDEKDFRFHKISTSESDSERKYEGNLLRRIFHKYKLIKMSKKSY